MVQQWKIDKVDELANDFKNHKVVAMVDLHDLPAATLLSIKTVVKKNGLFKMTKKRVLERAFDKSGNKNLKDLMNYNPKIPAVIITNENPFKVYKTLDKNKSPALAKEGDIAPYDLVVPAGDTGLPPGPAIADLQKAGLKASIQGQTIKVMEDKVVAKEGSTISAIVADVLSKLDIKPMEIGINLIGAWENGLLFDKSVLAVDDKEYENNIMDCFTKSFNLAYNVNYLTDKIAPLKITEAQKTAFNLALNAGIISKKTVDMFIQKAQAQLNSIASALPADARGNVKVVAASAPTTDEKGPEKKEEPKEEKKEEDAAAGLGALFG